MYGVVWHGCCKVVWLCMEIGKKVNGYGGKYRVTEDGTVLRGGKELTRIRGKYVNLSWRGAVEQMDVAYLVARAFVPNPTGRPYIKHKDGDRSNCNAENLEWVERKPVRAKTPRLAKVRVGQFDTEGHLLNVYESLYEAERLTGLHRQHIKRCCDGKQHSTKGFIWRYVN